METCLLLNEGKGSEGSRTILVRKPRPKKSPEEWYNVEYESLLTETSVKDGVDTHGR